MAEPAWSESLDGAGMLALQQRPRRVLRLAAAMAKAHVSIHSAAAQPELPHLRELLAARIDDAALAAPLNIASFYISSSRCRDGGI